MSNQNENTETNYYKVIEDATLNGTLFTEMPDVRLGFILTEEGRGYSEAGLSYVTDLVNKNYPPKRPENPRDGILWSAGAIINAPNILARQLRRHPDAFVIVSRRDNVYLMPNEDGQSGLTYADALEIYSEDCDGDVTSWQIMSDIIDLYLKRS